MMLQQHSLNQ